MDTLDFAILKHLQEDGRRPFTEIAKALGVTEGTVRNRVAKLNADRTVQIIGLVDPHRVGFQAPALINVSVETGKLNKVVEEVNTYPEVSYLLLISGEFDLLVEVMCPDRETLMELITERLHKIDGVTDTHTTFILHTYKVAQPNLDLIEQDQTT